MSSSAIGFTTVSSGPVGPTGAIGPTGPRGPTGSTFGATGATGPLAPHISNISFYGAGATVLLSDGVELTVLGAFGGLTAIEHTTVDVVDRLAEDIDFSTFSFLQSGNGTSSFVMKGISASGSLVITEDSEAIYINSIYTPASGAADFASLTDNTLIYLKTSNQISSTTIGITSGTFYDGVLNFERSSSPPSFSKILPRAKVKYVAPTHKTDSAQPVVLNLDDAGSFYIRTPNGISAFNGTFKPSEIVSFTLITESDDIWNFPANTYFEDGENYLTCGKSVLNITSFDQGASWYAVVAARGVDTTKETCELRGLFGSCCYSGPSGQNCLDYASKNQCDVLSGTFSPLQSCNSACGSTLGVCCSNGQCIENTNYAECIAFGGNFLFGVTCGSFGAIPDGSNLERLCFDECLGTKVACCKNGECLGDEFTKIECEEILGGLAFDGPCSDVDCCEQNIKVGACCKDAACTQKTLTECNASGGVFMGAGEICESVNCACIGTPVPLVYGSCCYCLNNQEACKITLQIDCETGLWQEDPKATSSSICEFTCTPGSLDCSAPNSRCCYYDGTNTTCTVTTEANCDSVEGTWTPGGLNCVSFTCDPCTSCNDGPCPDCIIQVPGIACRCDTSECFDVADTSVNGCPDGYTCHASPAVCADNPCGCGSGDDCDSIRTDSFPNDICPTQQTQIVSKSSIQSNRSSEIATLMNSMSTNDPNILVNTHAGLLVKDYYLDISPTDPDWNVNVTDDLNFCFSINLERHGGWTGSLANEELPESDPLSDQSVRVFLLRTWYPKNFAQNYAAYKGFKYRDSAGDSDVITYAVNENSENEIPVWNRLDSLFSDSTDEIVWDDILSAYTTKVGGVDVYHDKGGDFMNSVPFITDNLRKQLNCPLYGLNPRGKAPYMGNSSTLINIFNPLVKTDSPGNFYPSENETDNLRYNHSIDVGLRYRSISAELIGPFPPSMYYPYGEEQPNNISQYARIIRKIPTSPGLTYVNTSNTNSKSNYLMFSQTIPNNGLNYKVSYNNIDYMTHKFSGYTDLGVSVVDNEVNRFNSSYDIGYHLKHASLNNFSNNEYHYPGLEIISPNNWVLSNAGHPHTTSFEGNYVNSSLFSQSTKLQYSDSGDRNDSPLFLTKQSAILFDSGIITRNGNTIKTYFAPSIGSQLSGGVFSTYRVPHRKNVYYGAINDPSLPSPSQSKVTTTYYDTSSVDPNTQVKKYTYDFCVNLKNYKNTYMLDSNGVNDTSEHLLYGDLHNLETEPDLNIPSRKQFIPHVNKLRVVVMSYAHNPFMVGVTYSREQLLGSAPATPGVKTLESLTIPFLENIKFNDKLFTPSKYELQFRPIDTQNTTPLCQTSITTGCGICQETVDYDSNVYMIVHKTYLKNIHDCMDRRAMSVFDETIGIVERCGCDCSHPGCSNTHNIVTSCEDIPSCSCKGIRIAHSPPPCLDELLSCAQSDNIILRRACVDTPIRLDDYIFLFDVVTQLYIIKLKPIESVDLNGVIPNHILGNKLYMGPFGIHSSNCICNGCPDPSVENDNDITDLSSEILIAGLHGECYVNKCIIPDKSCNYGSDDTDTDLVKILENVVDQYTEFSCSIWTGGPSGISLQDHVPIYTTINQGAPCSSGFTEIFQNKSIPVGDGTFVCIPLECSVIDCTQYEDCSPS